MVERQPAAAVSSRTVSPTRDRCPAGLLAPVEAEGAVERRELRRADRPRREAEREGTQAIQRRRASSEADRVRHPRRAGQPGSGLPCRAAEHGRPDPGCRRLAVPQTSARSNATSFSSAPRNAPRIDGPRAHPLLVETRGREGREPPLGDVEAHRRPERIPEERGDVVLRLAEHRLRVDREVDGRPRGGCCGGGSRRARASSRPTSSDA